MTNRQRIAQLKKAETLVGRLAFVLGKASAVDAMIHLANVHHELVKLMKELEAK